jgi:hypothetical protein
LGCNLNLGVLLLLAERTGVAIARVATHPVTIAGVWIVLASE